MSADILFQRSVRLFNDLKRVRADAKIAPPSQRPALNELAKRLGTDLRKTMREYAATRQS